MYSLLRFKKYFDTLKKICTIYLAGKKRNIFLWICIFLLFPYSYVWVEQVKKKMKYLGKKLIMRWNTKYFNLTDFY